MIPINAPIRGLSAEVVFHTASAQREFWELLQAAGPDLVYPALPPALQAHVVNINRSMGEVVKSQGVLLQQLANVSGEQLSDPSFAKVVEDLERVVLQCDSAVTDAYSMPGIFAQMWHTNLELMSDLNGHIDNYAESFRITFDETCSSLLADLAGRVSATA